MYVTTEGLIHLFPLLFPEQAFGRFQSALAYNLDLLLQMNWYELANYRTPVAQKSCPTLHGFLYYNHQKAIASNLPI